MKNGKWPPYIKFLKEIWIFLFGFLLKKIYRRGPSTLLYPRNLSELFNRYNTRRSSGICGANNNTSYPFYFSFDVRGRQFTKAKLWSSPNFFGPRAYFRTTTTPATLVIDKIQLDDEGIYRCRVDYKNSPTRNSKVNFTVIGKYLGVSKYILI